MQTPTPEFWWAVGIGSIALLTIGFAYILSLVIHQRKHIVEQQRQKEQLRRLSTHLQSVREDERLRIAREIHDELGQVLTVAKMYLTVLQKNIAAGSSLSGSEARKRLGSTIEIIDDSISKVKTIAYDLRPIVLDDLGLGEAVEWEAGKFQKQTGIVCTVRSMMHGMKIEKKRAAAVFRIFQEAMTNIARHADATAVEITMRKEIDNLVLEVADNGKGITVLELEKPKSLGILGMKERAQFLRGDLSIGSHNGTGTKIQLSVPLKAGNNDKRKEM